MRKWTMAVVAVLAIGAAACGGDDGDDGNGGGSGGINGSGGSGGDPASENPCMIDPFGEACMACITELAGCMEGACAEAYDIFDACDANCSPDDQLCCSEEAIDVYDCMQASCPDALACITI